MPTIGVRQLKEQTSRVLRLVQEQDTEVEITCRGRVIARLVPATGARPAQDEAEVWSDLDRLADAIGRQWPAGVSAEDEIRAQRREL